MAGHNMHANAYTHAQRQIEFDYNFIYQFSLVWAIIKECYPEPRCEPDFSQFMENVYQEKYQADARKSPRK